MNVSKQTRTDIASTDRNYKRHNEPFLILEKITENMPLAEIDLNMLQLPENIKLADNEFHKPGSIDLLLGAE